MFRSFVYRHTRTQPRKCLQNYKGTIFGVAKTEKYRFEIINAVTDEYRFEIINAVTDEYRFEIINAVTDELKDTIFSVITLITSTD